MKRKRASLAEPLLPAAVVPEAILEMAKRAIESDRFRKPAACSVCNEKCAPGSTENLC